MSRAEFPVEGEQSLGVRWFQIIAGAIILLSVATISYDLLLTIVTVIPALPHFFPFGTGEFFLVVITASAGMWAGAAATKFIFPRVNRAPVFIIVATLMLIATVGGSLVMFVKGTHDGWEGVVSAIVFLVTSTSLLLGDGWNDLPGRKITQATGSPITRG